MNITFSSILKNIHQKKDFSLNQEEIKYLRQILQKHPYFQLPYYIIAQNSTEENDVTNAKIYFSTKKSSSQFANNHSPFINRQINENKNTSIPVTKNIQNIEFSKVESKHIKNLEIKEEFNYTNYPEENFFGNYIDQISKMPVKPINQEQNSTQFSKISKFLRRDKKSISLENEDENFQETNFTTNEDNSPSFTDVSTISLFKILLDQGKIETALAIYTQISAEDSEKKRILDSIMEEKCGKNI